MTRDPVETNGDAYRVVFENERVRVLEYRDSPGYQTQQHHHPDSVMVTLSSFTRRITQGDRSMDVVMPAETVRWLGAQEHAGHNTGDSETHCIFVELKEPFRGGTDGAPGHDHLGPDPSS